MYANITGDLVNLYTVDSYYCGETQSVISGTLTKCCKCVIKYSFLVYTVSFTCHICYTLFSATLLAVVLSQLLALLNRVYKMFTFNQ